MRPKGDWKQGPWNYGTREVLAKLWGLGKSAQQIAKVLSALTRTTVTRDAVIGKAHRMGLAKHQNAPKRTHTHNNRRAA